ncbi:MAG: HAD family hydrolase [Fibrobacteria bacterium]|nr:HAD family hydrolase [Fibrobacteria bacterium]
MNEIIMEKYFNQLLPLKPIPTDEKCICRLDNGELTKLKAILFDVYGTILISSSGDVGGLHNVEDNIIKALLEAGIHFKSKEPNTGLGKEIFEAYCNIIAQMHQEAKENNVLCPEVVIEEVWTTLLQLLQQNNTISSASDINIKELAVIFEFLCNPTFPMPGFKDTLNKLTTHKFTLGIISNAQFFTPMLLHFFLGSRPFLQEENLPFFDNRLLKYSYLERKAKPDIGIFAEVRDSLSNYHILPEEVLFVGNDMLKDIYPAHQVNFKTALFAGDKRSLRLRRSEPRVMGLTPDITITSLSQITDILKI